MAVPLTTSVTQTIEIMISPWRVRFPRARWVQPQDRHVTLKFLGPTPLRLDDWLQHRVREVAALTQVFETHLAALGGFPSDERAHVLWVGLTDGDGHLATMANALETALAPEFTPERRPFIPHVTVARSDLALEVPNGPTASPLIDAVVPVREIMLIRSHAARSSARYEPLGTFPLSDPLSP